MKARFLTLSFLTLSILIACGGARAQQRIWQPSTGHAQVPIWPGTIPDAQPYTGPEMLKTDSVDLVAGRPWTFINNVSRPTMTVYPPQGKNTGVAMVVFPGGGYQILAIDLEGTEVCGWLTAHGITCVLLKYRVPGQGKYPKSGPYPYSPMALEDAQRTVGLVRYQRLQLRHGLLTHDGAGPRRGRRDEQDGIAADRRAQRPRHRHRCSHLHD